MSSKTTIYSNEIEERLSLEYGDLLKDKFNNFLLYIKGTGLVNVIKYQYYCNEEEAEKAFENGDLIICEKGTKITIEQE